MHVVARINTFNTFYSSRGAYLLIAMDMKRHVDCRLVRIARGPEAPSGASSRSTNSVMHSDLIEKGPTHMFLLLTVRSMNQYGDLQLR